MKENRKVSVITITYGHENYITETLNGVLMQQYDGPVEFIIANDNSPDGTDEVVKKYLNENPPPDNFEIKYTKHEENMGMNPNFLWALQQATGQYIALCEGDDYWIDPLKLQTQFDLLSNNQDIDISCHPSYLLINNTLTDEIAGYNGADNKIIPFEEVLNKFAGTAPFQSMFFRKRNIETYLKLLSISLGGHSMTQIYFAYPNGILYFSKPMSVYRVESSSSVSKTLFTKRKTYFNNMMKNIHALEFFKSKIEDKYKILVDRRIRSNAMTIATSSLVSLKSKITLVKNYKLYNSPVLFIKLSAVSIYKRIQLKQIKRNS